MTDAAHPAASAEAAWTAAVARVLKSAGDGTLVPARSADGIAVGPLYPAADGAVLARAGAGPTTVLARADHPDLDDANALAREDLGNGAGGLALTVEGAATARGFGMRVRSGDELTRFLDGLGDRPIAMRLEAAPFAGRDGRAGLARWAARQGAGAKVALGLDPVGDMARTGTAPLPWSRDAGPTLSGELVADVAALRETGCAGSILSSDGRPYHEAGASEAEELAAVVGTALAYWRALEEAGLDPGETRDALAFTLVADTDLLLTLAKLRALRLLWASVEAACGLTPAPLRLHVETAWRTQSRRDPYTNLLRGAIAAAAALIGQADSLTVLPFTLVLGLPDPFARRLARNTALVLIEEAELGRVQDPGAGAGAVEALTEALCQAAWSVLQDIEAGGGLPAMLSSGAWQRRLAATRQDRATALREGRMTIVGASRFTSDHRAGPLVLRPAPPSCSALEEKSFPPLPSRRDAEGFEEGGA